MGDGIVSRLRKWAQQPLNGVNADATQWALFFVFFLCVAFAWSRVVRKISEG